MRHDKNYGPAPVQGAFLKRELLPKTLASRAFLGVAAAASLSLLGGGAASGARQPLCSEHAFGFRGVPAARQSEPRSRRALGCRGPKSI